MPQQAAEESLTPDVFDLGVVRMIERLGRSPGASGWDRAIPQSLVRAIRIMIQGEGPSDVIEMRETEAEEEVQAFAFEAADPGCRMAKEGRTAPEKTRGVGSR